MSDYNSTPAPSAIAADQNDLLTAHAALPNVPMIETGESDNHGSSSHDAPSKESHARAQESEAKPATNFRVAPFKDYNMCQLLWMGIWLNISHFFILMKKNVILSFRKWKTSLIQILSPVVIIFVLWIIVMAAEGITNKLTYVHPGSRDISMQIPRCASWGKKQCVTFAYSLGPVPNVSQEIIDIVLKYNDQLPQNEIMKFDTRDELYSFIENNPNTTQTAVAFTNVTTLPSSQQLIEYDMLYNTTSVPAVESLKLAVDNAILMYSVQESSGIELTDYPIKMKMKGFPKPPARLNGQVLVFSRTGPQFFSLSMMLIFIVTLYSIVSEKEYRLRFGMQIMGLKDSAYWLSWLITQMFITLLASLVIIISGYIFQLSFFLRANFLVLLSLFVTYGFSLIAFAFLISTLVSKGRAALILGFIFLGATYLLNLLVANSIVVYGLYSDGANAVWRILLSFYPPFNFAKIFADISFKSLPVYSNVERKYVDGPGYSIADVYRKNTLKFPGEETALEVPPSANSYYLLLMNAAIFFILTWYLDNVIPRDTGVSRPPWFFVYPSYWGFHFKRKRNLKSQFEDYTKDVNENDMDPDVRAEFNAARDPTLKEGKGALRIVNLRKQFRSLTLKGFKTVRAVRGLNLCVDQSTCLALLGHNGAGKTTTISILVGMLTPSHGDAFIFGKSVRYDMDEIRKAIGVCPQHDILWDDLTAREHLQIFAEFKGIPRKHIKDEIDKRLRDVNLYEVGNKTVGTFSGGMKRRLSVAISCIGDPEVIILDEPTTGMDPHSRRQIWELIHSMKKGKRIILLTTHAMDEADALSDRIAIMAFGTLKCIGDSLHLKQKYGAGYNLSIVANPTRVDELKRSVADQLKGK
eukprot:GEZU01010510.1.p1 GENE.GEZU01010510.1~~GEZU01010510.1.p1  ORF type:complete len:865 (+),score=220.98 GEZU01010510.1:155-2749(+)